jgi:hypothetical protein
MEGRLGFGALLERLSDIRLVDGRAGEYVPSFVLRGLKELHLTFRAS